MGNYINKNSKGEKLSQIGKVKELLKDGASIVSDSHYQENMICVVENGWMDAAVFVSNEDDFNFYNQPDNRPKTWLIHNLAKNLID